VPKTAQPHPTGSAAVLNGRQFKFQIAGFINRGGFGEVHRATVLDHPEMSVAIKQPLPSLPQDVRELFLREADAARRVSSPHAIRVIDWGEEPIFIAFELATGPTLREVLAQRIAQNTPWSEPELIESFLQLCRGMEEINRHVIHRDLKPDNCFVCEGGLKIADFGIAKYVGEATRTLTFKGFGTLPYMAPETLRGDSVSWPCDQYSLGVMFFEMATLELPFKGSEDTVEHSHLFDLPPRITAKRSDLSLGLATVVAKMLEKVPGDRYKTWNAVIAAIEAVRTRSGGLPPSQGDSPATALARKVAEQLHARKSAELEVQQQREQNDRRRADRNELLGHWIQFLHRIADSTVSEVNASQNAQGLTIHAPAERGHQARFSVEFLDKSFDIALEPFPLSAPEQFTLWGYALVKTNNRIWATNFLIEAEPQPYGTFRSFDLTVHPWTPDDGRASFEGVRARYERPVIGSRIVLAVNAEAVLAQIELRQVMSLLQWAEGSSDFGALFTEGLTALVEDAALPPREIPQPRRRRRGPFGDEASYDDQW
jgi:serine/threonine protein kinase